MTFDELKRTWQSQQTGFKLTIDSNMLLNQVKRSKEYFESAIFWRDVREAGLCALLSIFFLYCGIRDGLWPLYLLAVLCLWVAVFMLADRIVQKRRQPSLSDSLFACVKTSMAQIEHQIWLLKNVLWWYLLPPGVGLIIWFAYCGISVIATEDTSFGFVLFVFGCIFGTILLYYGIYRLNQYAVRKELEPRRAELEQLLRALENGDRQSTW